MAQKELEKLLDPSKCLIEWHSGCLFIKTLSPSKQIMTYFSVKITPYENECDLFVYGSPVHTGYLVPLWFDFQPGVKDLISSGFDWNVSITGCTQRDNLRIHKAQAFVNYLVQSDHVFFLSTIGADQMDLMRFDQFLALVKFFLVDVIGPVEPTEMVHYSVVCIPSPDPDHFLC